MADVRYLFPDGRKSAVTFSYDDGQTTDRRLVERFDHYGFKGTFNIPTAVLGGTNYLAPEELPELFANHEVAVHGLHHPFLERISRSQMVGELLQDRQRLEEIMGKPVTGMAYPYGTYDPEVLATLRGLGFSYARTAGDETGNFRFPQDWMVWRPCCHHKRALEFVDGFLQERWMLTVFYIWGHSWEFDRDGNWEIIEQLGERLARLPQVWYATNGELQHYLDCVHRLVFTVALDVIYNPTDTPVWMWLPPAGKPFVIAPGQTLALK